jgi:hypothetical protein
MKQEHIDRIKKMVTDVGIRDTLKLLGGNKDIIQKVYTDNPISYLENLKHKPYVDRTLFRVTGYKNYLLVKNYNFAWVDPGSNHLIINNHTTEYKFYKSIMELDTRQTCDLIKGWLVKHYDLFVIIKNLKPIPNSV